MTRQNGRQSVVVAPVFVNGVCIAREMARKGAHVVAVDTKPGAVGFRSRYVSECVVLGSPQDEPGAFRRWLLSRRDLYGAIVVPTDDFFVRELSEGYDALSRHYRLAVSPGRAVGIALDKMRSYEAAWEIGVATPRTRRINRGSDIEAAAEHVGFPALLKPVFSIAFYGRFGTKLFVVNNAAELKEACRLADEAGHAMILQEMIPGPDENVLCCKTYVSDDGEVHPCVIGSKECIYPPSFGVTQVQVVINAPEVERQAAAYLKHIGYRGALACIEWKRDPRDGLYKLIELNARSVLAIGLAKYAGVDLIDMLRRDKLGLAPLPAPAIKYGRRWAYLKNGVLLYRKHPEKRKTLGEYLRLYRPPICFGLLELSDLKPFLYDVVPLLARRFTRKASE